MGPGRTGVNRSSSQKNDRVERAEATSKIVAEIILVAITILLASLVFLLFSLPGFNLYQKTPGIIEIRAVYHTSESPPYQLNNDSRIVLYHNGTESLFNDDLRAVIYVNGVRTGAVIETLNGYNFIQTHHYGVQWIGGSGCQGSAWNPGEKLVIDLADGTIHEGDTLRVDIVDKRTNRTISSDEYGSWGSRRDEWWRCSLPYPLGCI